MRLLKLLILTFFFSLLLLPAAQMRFRFLPAERLFGVSVPRMPKFSREEFLTGEYQRKLEQWIVRNSKLWGLIIKTENQLNFWLFSQLSSGYGGSLHVGTENYLYQWLYILDSNSRNHTPPEALRERVQMIKELQDYLQKRGKAFLLLISNNKVSYYPELVPEGYRSKFFLIGKRNYDQLKALLDEYAIEYLDASELFRAKHEEYPYPVFNKGGSHWTQLGACLVSEELINRLEQQLKQPLRRIQCSKDVEMREMPLAEDRDLARLANLWTPRETYGVTSYTKVEPQYSGEEFRPGVFIVGTSFIWAIRSILERIGFYERSPFYFYFNTNYFFVTDAKGKRQRGRRAVNKGKLKWEEQVFSHDVIILEASDALIHQVGFGFLEEFRAQVLGHTPSEATVQ